MHPVTARIHHFFVPNRLIWDTKHGDLGSFEDFITGGPDGADAQNPPKVNTSGATKDLFDYLGIPRVSGLLVNIGPIRSFNLIYNEYYRDQDLVEERELDDLTIPQIAWEKDYFTSARPWTQKGPDVTIPLGEKAPIQGLGKSTSEFTNNPLLMNETGGGQRTYESSSDIVRVTYPTMLSTWKKTRIFRDFPQYMPT